MKPDAETAWPARSGCCAVVALLLRLAETSGRGTLQGDEPGAPALTKAPALAKDETASSERAP